MESQGSSRTYEDQLQDTALQDPSVRTHARSVKTATDSSPKEEKIIIHSDGKLIRGYCSSPQLALGADDLPPATLRLRRTDSTLEEDVPLNGFKAVFFVKSFDGQPLHEDLHFYDEDIPQTLLWVRIIFRDGEIMECLVENSEQFIMGRYFFAQPVDPDCNNKLMFLNKCMIANLKVLALRPDPRSNKVLCSESNGTTMRQDQQSPD